MKPRFVLYRRNGTFYCQDNETGQQLGLRTKDESEARTLLAAPGLPRRRDAPCHATP